jgi:hypothetical protein
MKMKIDLTSLIGRRRRTIRSHSSLLPVVDHRNRNVANPIPNEYRIPQSINHRFPFLRSASHNSSGMKLEMHDSTFDFDTLKQSKKR